MALINERVDKISMLKNRDMERQLNIQKKKEDKNLITADNEKIDYFQRVFLEKQNSIESLINNSTNVPKADLPNHFTIISKEILTLQKYVAASNIFLRNYDIKKCQDIIQSLTEKARQFEDELIPKKKFGFKNKNKPVSQEAKFNGHNKCDEVDSIQKLNKIIKNSCGLFNRSNEVLIMCDEELFKKDVSIEKLENCTVILKGSPSTLHLDYLKNCQLFSGPVSTSVFAQNCENCTLVIACQQLRLHSSTNVNIYLHVTSRAIMEDCKDIFFAPYNWDYPGFEEDFKKALLDININNWKCIDDFNWLNMERQSPNWGEIEQESRVEKWDI